MNVCTKNQNVKTPVPGRLYLLERDNTDHTYIYICDRKNTLINLSTGSHWYYQGGFGTEGYSFTDVTDKYCLKFL